jgi:hypothetical protein
MKSFQRFCLRYNGITDFRKWFLNVDVIYQCYSLLVLNRLKET